MITNNIQGHTVHVSHKTRDSVGTVLGHVIALPLAIRYGLLDALFTHRILLLLLKCRILGKPSVAQRVMVFAMF